jgi:hypothetical protein
MSAGRRARPAGRVLAMRSPAELCGQLVVGGAEAAGSTVPEAKEATP